MSIFSQSGRQHIERRSCAMPTIQAAKAGPAAPALWLLLLLLAVLMSARPLAAQALADHDSLQEIDIESDQIEVRENDGRAVLTGNVKVVQGKLTLTANELVVHYDVDSASENPSLRRLDARGDVRLISDTEEVESVWGVYDIAERLVTLGGDVVLVRGDNRLKGERLELDLVTGLAKLDGDSNNSRVRGRFTAPPPRDDTPPNPG